MSRPRARHPGTPVARRDLEEGAFVQHRMDERLDVVDLAPVAGHEVQERLVAPFRVVFRRAAWRHLPDIGRQVTQEAADYLERLFLGVGEVVDAAAYAGMNVRAAELFLGDVVAERRLDHRRSTGKQLARILHHDVEVRDARVDCRAAGDRAHHRRDHRHLRQHVDVDQPPGTAVRQVRPPDLLEVPDAAAGRVEQAHQGYLPLTGALVGGKLRTHPAPSSARAAPDGEVTGGEDDLAAVHARRPLHHRPRSKGFELVVLVGPLAGKRIELAEAALVDQAGDTLACCQLAVQVLAFDAVRTTHPFAQHAASLDFRDFRAPPGLFHSCHLRSSFARPAIVAYLHMAPQGTHSPDLSQTHRVERHGPAGGIRHRTAGPSLRHRSLGSRSRRRAVGRLQHRDVGW